MAPGVWIFPNGSTTEEVESTGSAARLTGLDQFQILHTLKTNHRLFLNLFLRLESGNFSFLGLLWKRDYMAMAVLLLSTMPDMETRIITSWLSSNPDLPQPPPATLPALLPGAPSLQSPSAKLQVPPRSRHFRENRSRLLEYPDAIIMAAISEGKQRRQSHELPGKPSECGASRKPLQRAKDVTAGHLCALNGPRTASPRFLLTCRQVFLKQWLLLAGWGSLPTRTFLVRQAFVPVTPLSPGSGRAYHSWLRRKGRAARTERWGRVSREGKPH